MCCNAYYKNSRQARTSVSPCGEAEPTPPDSLPPSYPRSGQCASFTDGADYAFDITYRGERFSLDTCETALANDAGLQTELTRIFQVVATPEEFSFIDNEFQQAGVLGFVFPHLRER